MSKELQEDDVDELIGLLDGESEEGHEEEPEVEEPGEEGKTVTEEEEEEPTQENDEEEKEEEEPKEEKKVKTENKTGLPVFKKITEKYPKFFKDFPSLRHAFFHAKEYRELFPTVEDAREAMDKIENLEELEEVFKEGNANQVIKTLKNYNEESISKFANEFLPSVRKLDQELYFQVITPELVRYTRELYTSGIRNENDNLKNAALVVANFLFGDPKVASGEKEVKSSTPAKENQKDDKLERERQEFRRERYTAFYNDVVKDADEQLSDLISEGLDPKNTMTSGVKELVVDKVLKEVSRILSMSSGHKRRMDSLWKKASETNFSTSNKSKIISAYLEAAEEIMPKIRSKIKANVLGIRDRHSVKQPGSENGNDRKEPKGGGAGSRSSSNGKSIDTKNIDWSKTSDVDVLNGNITYKK